MTQRPIQNSLTSFDATTERRDRMTAKTAKPKGLEGRCFIIWEDVKGYENPMPNKQGIVIAQLSPSQRNLL
jgi:hypothetical protein